jgi:hypothetical protein
MKVVLCYFLLLSKEPVIYTLFAVIACYILQHIAQNQSFRWTFQRRIE